MLPFVYCSIIYSRQDMEATYVLINRNWIKKKQYVYIIEQYLAIKKEQNLTICDIDEPRGYYAKQNKSDRERQIPYYLIYMWNLKNKINEQTKQRLIDTENKPMVARWKGAWEWAKKQNGLRSTSWQLQNSHEDVKYSIGTIVNSIVIAMYSARWYQTNQ